MPVVRKTKIDNALDSFYSSLGDKLGANKKEDEEKVQPEYIEDTIAEVELTKHTFSERKIIKNYQKKPLQQRASLNSLQKCKVCGQQIPASEMSEHVRIELMDPKYFTAKRNERERNKNPNNDAQISRHLKELASRRTDIFGEDEVEIGKEIGEDHKQSKKRDREKEKVSWDGVAQGGATPGLPPPTGTPLTVQEQIAAIHSKKGVMPPAPGNLAPPMGGMMPPQMLRPPMGTPGLPPGMPPPPVGVPPPFSQPPMHHLPPMQPPLPMQPPPPMQPPMGVPHPMAIPRPPPPTMPVPQPPQSSQEPPMKKMKPDKSLLPANEFIAKSPDKVVRAKVECPNMADKEGLKLNGQIITLQMSLADTVMQLKEKLEQAVGLKPNKQKLVIEDGTILKDNNSFADLNLAGDVQISLKIKERGGKK